LDLEGLARVLDESTAKRIIADLLKIYKGNSPPVRELPEAIVQEVKNSRKAESFELLRVYKVGAKAGESGLGSRGFGDHLIHKYLLQMSGGAFEDAGIVEDIIVSVDGFTPGCLISPSSPVHATRAAVRT
jgi:Hydrogenase maturation factor